MKRFKYKRFAAILSVLMLSVLLAGCGSTAALTKPVALEGVTTYDVAGTCELERSGDTFIVTGETDLMNNALIHISLHAQSGHELDGVTISKTEDAVRQEFLITSDVYTEEVKSVTAYITCAPKMYGNQSEAVIKQYGEEFEYIVTEEENRIWNSSDGVIVLFASESVGME